MKTAFAILALVALAGCSTGSKTPTGPSRQPSAGLEICGADNIMRGSNFSNPTRIDNRFYPLIPGRQFVLEGRSNRGGTPLPHRVIFTVTDLTKVIGGVRTLVLWDRDYNNDRLEEAELAFLAQDDEGSVWVLGEYPEEYQNGIFVGAPSTWIARVESAEAGILLPGKLDIGYQFLQGFVPDIDFLDCGMVFAQGQSVCIPYGCYEDVLVIDEASPLEPGSGHQRKYYAPGVGNIQIGAVDDPEGETLVVTNIVTLAPEAMEEARRAALKLEARAYQISEAYRHTLPIELPAGALTASRQP